jgi:hypothetical protein
MKKRKTTANIDVQLTIFNPKCLGANSTARTLPFASANVARSTQRKPRPTEPLFPPLPVRVRDGAAFPAPLIPGSQPSPCDEEEDAKEEDAGISSQILTLRSKEEDATMGPNSGWAQESLVIAASCAFVVDVFV